jgi:SOS-response transcriptional repressor LexA
MKFIGRFWQKNGVTPSYAEMVKGLGYSSPAPVQYLVKQLIQKNYLLIADGRHRNLQIVHSIGNIPVVGTCD